MKPQESREFKNIDFIHPFEVKFFKKFTKELVFVLSEEWLEESKLSKDVICLNYSYVTFECQIDKHPFTTHYNPIVGVNIMSLSFAKRFVEDMPLIPTIKTLKSLSGHIIPSL
jgi:hypothetical protein